MRRTIDLIKVFAKPAVVVLTFCPPTGKEIEDTEAAVHALCAALCPVRIGTRVAYSRAQQTGRSAQEIEPNSKAAVEIESLYRYTRKHIYRERGENDQVP